MKMTALVWGVNDYPGTSMDLQGCVNDVNDMVAKLVARNYVVTRLTDAAATRAKIPEIAGNMIADAKSGDCVVWHNSSHGTQVPDENGDEPDGLDEAVVPYDVMENGVITDDELAILFGNRHPGVHLTVICDSCFSGTLSRFAHEPVTMGMLNDPTRSTVRYMPAEVFLPGIANGDRSLRTGRAGRHYNSLFMQGCQEWEYCYDAHFNGRANGAFTRAALDALDALRVGATYDDWQAAIRKALPSQRYPQTPVLYGTSARRHRPVLA